MGAIVDVHLDAELGRAHRHRTVQGDPRRPVAPAEDLDVARAKDLHLQRLAHRLLGAEPRGEVLRRAPLRRGVRALAVGEQPLGQPGPALERLLEAVDLEEVDPDAHRREGTRPLATPP